MANNKNIKTKKRNLKTVKNPVKIKKRKFKRSTGNPLFVGFVVVLFVAIGVTADLYYADTFVGELINSSIGKFFNLFSFFENYHLIILESITVLIFIWVLSKVLHVFVKIFFRGTKRNKTIGIIFSGIMRYVLILSAIFLILGAWGVEATTLLAGAGILGLAISFGAQSLIEDILSGLFIISEKQFSIGDVIEIDGFRGKVIEMSIRTTKFENISGDTKIMNNSDIRGAINTSSNLSPAICDISISYTEDLDKVEKIIYKNLDGIRERMVDIIDGPYYFGVQALSDSSVVLRVVGYVHEDKKLQAIRDLNREMKLIFDKNNIQIPFPQLVIHQDNSTKKKPSPKKKTTKPKTTKK
ncbi:MAG: mechanosensitive ion channel family protein [Candidatus Izemoplasmataceae bacterium]